jgi:hypothetical protein
MVDVRFDWKDDDCKWEGSEGSSPCMCEKDPHDASMPDMQAMRHQKCDHGCDVTDRLDRSIDSFD